MLIYSHSLQFLFLFYNLRSLQCLYNYCFQLCSFCQKTVCSQFFHLQTTVLNLVFSSMFTFFIHSVNQASQTTNTDTVKHLYFKPRKPEQGRRADSKTVELEKQRSCNPNNPEHALTNVNTNSNHFVTCPATLTARISHSHHNAQQAAQTEHHATGRKAYATSR